MLIKIFNDLIESTGNDPTDRCAMMLLVPVVLLLWASGIALGIRVFLLVAWGV